MARKKKAAKRQFKGMVSRNAAKQQRGSQFGYLNLPKGIQMFKEEPGSRMNLDILPYLVTSDFHLDKDEEYGIAVKGSLWYKKPFWLHRYIGPDNRSVVCPTSIGQRCPICEYRAQQLKEGADWQDEAIRALKPSLRNLYVVVPKGHKKYEEIPHIWDMSQFLFQDSLNEEIQENEEHEVFPDLEEGLTLRIRFSEESFGNNKFAKTSRIDFRDRTKQYNESILKEVPNLDDILEVLSPKTIETLFFGGVPEEHDEEQQSTARSSRKVKRVEYIEEDDEDETEEIEFVEDEEEELEFVVNEDEDEIEDEEEDEEEEEEEDEEPPKPAPKTKKAAAKTKKAPAAKKNKSKCPHGYKFGTDFEEYDECDECDLWEECMDAESSKK